MFRFLFNRRKKPLSGLIESLFKTERSREYFHLRKSKHSILDILTQLPTFSKSLQTVCMEVEPRFLQLGHELQTVYFDATDLTKKTLEAARLIGRDSEESVLPKVSSLARKSLMELRNCQKEASANLDHVNTLSEGLEELCKISPEAEKIGLSLRISGLSLGIESSRYSESAGMFVLLAQEIKNLSEKVATIGKTIRKDSKATRISHISTHGEIFESLNRLNQLAEDGEKAVKEAVEEIEQLIEISFQSLEKAEFHSREISRQIGEIVAGIQLHDSMSQRIEHITRTLHDVEQLCREALSHPPSSNTSKDKLGHAHSVLNLQLAQLQQVVSEINEVYHKNREAFDRIRDHVDRLTQSLMGGKINGNGKSNEIRMKVFHAPIQMGTSVDPFTSLQSAVENLHQVLGQGYALITRIRGTATQAFETTARLTSSMELVRGISFETHLKALNAIVKASHLGEEGRTFEVLAHEMKRLSDQSNRFAANVEKILNGIDVSAQELRVNTLEKTTPNSCFHLEELDAGMKDISRVYARFIEDSSRTFQHAGTLKDSISQISTSLDFFPALASELTKHLHQLEDFSHKLIPWTTNNGENLADKTEKVAQRYTMKRERDIHEQVIGRMEGLHEEAMEETEDEMAKKEEMNLQDAPIQAHSTDDQQTEEKEEEDLGDNVELF